MPAALREERVSNKHFAPSTLSGLLADALREWGRLAKRVWQAAGQGRAGHPQTPEARPKPHQW